MACGTQLLLSHTNMWALPEDGSSMKRALFKHIFAHIHTCIHPYAYMHTQTVIVADCEPITLRIERQRLWACNQGERHHQLAIRTEKLKCIGGLRGYHHSPVLVDGNTANTMTCYERATDGPSATNIKYPQRQSFKAHRSNDKI